MSFKHYKWNQRDSIISVGLIDEQERVNPNAKKIEVLGAYTEGCI